MRAYKLKHLGEWKQEETAKYMFNKRLRPLLNKQDVNLRTDSNNMTLTRILGHKERMKGSGRWLMQTQIERDGCWRCDQWGFTLFFWNEKIGKFNNVNKISVNPETMINLTDMIRMNCQDSYMENPETPVLFSNVTNW